MPQLPSLSFPNCYPDLNHARRGEGGNAVNGSGRMQQDRVAMPLAILSILSPTGEPLWVVELPRIMTATPTIEPIIPKAKRRNPRGVWLVGLY